MSEIIEVIKNVTTVTIASDGPQGPAGPLGPTGPTGPEGAAGAPGSSGVISVVAPITNTGTSTSAIIGINSGVANGVATLDSNGKVPQSQIPAVAITNTFVVASQAAMLALTAEEGDVAVRTDQNKTYILTATPSSTLANWQELLTPTDTVTSVDGRIGTVTLTDLYAGLATANTFTGGVQQITTASISSKGLIIRPFSVSQTANLLETQDGSGNAAFRVDASSNLILAATGSISWNSVSTLSRNSSTGQISLALQNASGASFLITAGNAAAQPLILKGAASQTANLQEWQNSAGTIVAKINQVGSAVFGNATINAAGNLNAYASTTTTIPMVVRGAASQTANLQEWQNSAGTVLFSITSGGAFGNQVTANAGIDVVGGGNGLRSIAGAATVVPIVSRGAVSQTAALQRWEESTGTVLTQITSTGDLVGSANFGVRGRYILNVPNTGAYLDTNLVSNAFAIVQRVAGNIAFVVRGAASQTANLQEWQNSAGTVLASVTSAGNIALTSTFGIFSAPQPSLRNTSSGGGIYFDSGSGGTAGSFIFRTGSGLVNVLTITGAGTINFVTGNTSATANTGAVALPALAVGFIEMQVAGTTVKVPYYAN